MQIIMKIQLAHIYQDIVSLGNLLEAWKEFLRGKRDKKDVQEFSLRLMDNILSLHDDLVNRTYCHGDYTDFYVNDPKRRHIHKANVRDRLLHHAIYRILYSFFDKIFIPDSFSCRNNKGTHKAINRFRKMFYKVSKNNHCACWVLKCDIKKFFDSIDHDVLLGILSEYILDKDVMRLLGDVIMSFRAPSYDGVNSDEESFKYCKRDPSTPLRYGRDDKCGLPLGNLTSQLFANVYLNVFDQFAKHKLKVKYYIRYADDFVFLSEDKNYLEDLIPRVQKFLSERLKLTLHPSKIFLQTISSGIDFLGWKHFIDHRILRKTTQRRILRRIKTSPVNETIQSYLGLLKHGNSVMVREEMLNVYCLRKE